MARTYKGSDFGSFGETGASITFEWEPDPDIIADELMKVAGYLEDMQSPLQISKQVLIEDIRARFDTKTDPDGSTWVEWSESYAPRAIAVNVNGILERTGDLRAAATSESAFLVTENSIFYDTAGLPEYWIWNQSGAERGSHEGGTGTATTIEELKLQTQLNMSSGRSGNTLPPRPFVGTSFEAETQILDIFDQWFDGAISLGVSSTGKAFARHSLRGPGGRFVSRG